MSTAPSSDETIVIGDGNADLRALVGPRLKRLRIAASPIADLSPLAGCPLEELEINFTFVEDLSPLEQIPTLRKLRLFGNPLTPSAYGEQVAALRSRVAVLEISPRDEWELNRRVWDAGHRLCYGRTPRTPILLVQPGRGADGLVRHVEIWPDTVAAALAKSDDELLAEGYSNPTPEPDAERFLCPYVSGDATEARAWVKRAKLSKSENEALAKFITRFADQVFYRDSEAAVASFEAKRGLRVPQWLRRLRIEALAGVHPASPALPVRFDRFDLAPPGERHRPDHYFEVGLLGSPSGDRAAMERDRCRVLVVGESADTSELESTLVVQLGSDWDMRVFEFGGSEALFEQARAGKTPSAVRDPVFDSYATLLGHVAAFRVDGADIAAKRG